MKIAGRNIDTGYRAREWAVDMHAQIARHRFSVPIVNRRAGKTVACINIDIDAAARFPRKDGRFAYIAPFLKQAKSLAWDYLIRYSSPIPGATISQSNLTVTLPNGSQIRLYGADNPDALRGIYLDGVVLDEYAQMKPQLWGEVLRPALSDRLGWCIFSGTPKGYNALYDAHLMAMKAENRGTWWTDIYPVTRTKTISEAELADARRTMSEAQYRQEFLCDFSASSDDILITIDLVTAACQRVMPMPIEKHLDGLPKIVGVDVARFGDDSSVIQRRWGHVALEPLKFRGLDNMQLVGRIATVLHQWNPDMCFIDAGGGQGVVDRLRQLGHSNIIEVNFGGRANDELHYENIRCEMWDNVRLWLEAGATLPDDIDLRRDLTLPSYDFNPATNRKRLESKDSMKKRAKSPDCGDALALTFAYPVTPRGHRIPLGQGARYGRVVSDYDPRANL